MDITDKTPISVEKDKSTEGTLEAIAESLGKLVDIQTSIGRELFLANDLKRMELIASAYRHDNLNDTQMQDYLSKINTFFSIWRT